jgi:hypothetical protein
LDPEVIAAFTVPTSLAAIVLGFGHYVTKWRRLTPSTDVEKRLARLEVAIDDMTAELSRLVEGQQFANKLLADRSPEQSRVAR